MARRLRIQFPGATYHLINRGNYRRDLFATVGAARAFETVLGDAASRFQWVIHAYCLLRNHFHLAVTTPVPNLSDGMHWLQTTFALRFNRFRSEQGHLFQGRYQSPLVQDAAALVRVVDYIHLNPVHAGLVAVDRVAEFRWSSLARFTKGPRPPWLSATTWLGELGLLDRPTDWQRYVAGLRALAEDRDEQSRRGFDRLSRDWAIGSHGWKQALARKYAARTLEGDLPKAEVLALKVQRWTLLLEEELRRRGKDLPTVGTEPTNAGWKVEIAAALRARGGIPYRWIAGALAMGSPLAVRVAVHRLGNM